MDRITADIIKEKLIDGNGGTAWVFSKMFDQLDAMGEKIDCQQKLSEENYKKLMKCIQDVRETIQPMLDKFNETKTVKGWFSDKKSTISGVVIFIMLIANFVGMILTWAK